ncbi:type II toxin-antitoxin system RelE/ParE family toxin [Luteibaculum oceani]|uniref:Type II toxin-antitoxin system RelE/ParE family toxin n=1 Tax=Luteibaculum oceani TaxID=1294296 RepID=A0A5C6V4Z0_9FLAO|nr:type II toxin-antitoxin system RelE/ParE family toxin [Luteibaculum oceani]TXC78868.1 type II toxin-antitoxin system RelE/ParE family toxin [Luteibaculum oceani]
MAKRQVVWTQTADIQLTIVLEYWVNRTQSVTFSRKLLHKVTERTLQIAEKPQMYRKAGLENIRVASMGNYSIYYKHSDKELIVLAFWDNRQDSKELLHLLKR